MPWSRFKMVTAWEIEERTTYILGWVGSKWPMVKVTHIRDTKTRSTACLSQMAPSYKEIPQSLKENCRHHPGWERHWWLEGTVIGFQWKNPRSRLLPQRGRSVRKEKRCHQGRFGILRFLGIHVAGKCRFSRGVAKPRRRYMWPFRLEEYASLDLEWRMNTGGTGKPIVPDRRSR